MLPERNGRTDLKIKISGMRLGVMNVFHMQSSWFETLCLLLKHVLQ